MRLASRPALCALALQLAWGYVAELVLSEQGWRVAGATTPVFDIKVRGERKGLKATWGR